MSEVVRTDVLSMRDIGAWNMGAPIVCKAA